MPITGARGQKIELGGVTALRAEVPHGMGNGAERLSIVRRAVQHDVIGVGWFNPSNHVSGRGRMAEAHSIKATRSWNRVTGGK